MPPSDYFKQKSYASVVLDIYQKFGAVITAIAVPSGTEGEVS